MLLIRDKLKEKFTIKIDFTALLAHDDKKPDKIDAWRYLKQLNAKWPSLFNSHEETSWSLFKEIDEFKPKGPKR